MEEFLLVLESFQPHKRKVINDTRKCEIFGSQQSVVLIQGRSLFE